MAGFVTRFAPSPTGRLHLGHVYSAARAFGVAADAGGVCRLRIEDIDQTRCTPEYTAGVLEDLRWLGFSWPDPVRVQSEHFADYVAALDRLRARGVLYRCFKTRREVLDDIARAPHGAGEGPDGAVYLGPSTPLSPDEEAERLARGEPFAWRLSLARSREILGQAWDCLGFLETGAGPAGETAWIAAEPRRMGDVVLARKDVGVAYHLAVVHDDALEGVTHVVRGADLFAATHVHVVLQALLGLPTPVYAHHPLRLGPDGKRFAKRDGAVTIASLRDAGRSPAEVRAMAGL